MLISLFPKCKALMLAGEAIAFMFSAAIIYDKDSFLLAFWIFLSISIVVFLFVSAYAALLHHKLLMILYTLQQPKNFILLYNPLVRSNSLSKSLRFTMNAYLSNAYAALGDFSHALAILDEMPESHRKDKLKSEVIQASNRCSIALSSENLADAKKEYAHLEELISLHTLSKQDQNSYSDTLTLLRSQLHTLSGDCTQNDINILLFYYKKCKSPLRKTELAYSLALVFLVCDKEHLALPYLKQVASSPDDLYVCHKARKLITELN